MLPLPEGKILAIRWKGEVGVCVDPGCGMYSLRFVMGGDYRYYDGRRTFCSKPDLLIPPDQPFAGHFQNISLLFVDLSPGAVQRALGVTPLPRATGLCTFSPGEAAQLRTLASSAARTAEQLSPRLRPKFLRNFQHAMAASLALLLREMRDQPRTPDPMIGRRKVADLCEWAALDRDEPLTIGDLSAHCGLGPRALEKNFLRHFDTTPLVYLRNLRLAKVRRLLQDEAAAWSVTAAALEAGFAHLGRFSAFYRERFGECPSETRNRTLGPPRRHIAA